MEFFLAKDVEVKFVNDGNESTGYYPSSKRVLLKLEPVERIAEHIRGIYLEKLCSLLAVDPINNTNLNTKTPEDVNLNIRIRPSDGTHQNRMGEGGYMGLLCFTTGEGTFLERVFNAFKLVREGPGEGATDLCNAAIRLNVRLPGTQDSWAIDSIASKIKVVTIKDTGSLVFRIKPINGEVSHKILQDWITGTKEFKGIFSVILVLNDAAVNTLFVPVRNHPTSFVLTALREMLENEAEADTEIIPGGDGARPVKCHRAFLASRSSVFRAMFQSGMQEAATNKIKIPEMTERLIRAFIKYLYTLDVEEPVTDCRLAFEMLKAANCYDVTDLRTSMYELLMMKRADWFNVDVALDLLLYTKNMTNCTNVVVVNVPEKKKMKLEVSEDTMWKDLNRKSIKILTWYSKEKHSDLMTSENFKRLHEETPQLAMELHASFIKYVDVNAWGSH